MKGPKTSETVKTRCRYHSYLWIRDRIGKFLSFYSKFWKFPDNSGMLHIHWDFSFYTTTSILCCSENRETCLGKVWQLLFFASGISDCRHHFETRAQHQKSPKMTFAFIFRTSRYYFQILQPKTLPWTNFQRQRMRTSHRLAKNQLHGTSRCMQNVGQFPWTGPNFEN